MPAAAHTSRSRSTAILLALMLIIIGGAVGQTWWAIRQDRQLTLDAEAAQAQQTLRLLERQANLTLDAAARRLDAIAITAARAELDQSAMERLIRDAIEDHLRTSRAAAAFQYVNLAGQRWVSQRDFPSFAFNTEERAYLMALAAHPAHKGVLLGEPFQRFIDNLPVLPMARTLFSRDGRVLGVLSTEIGISEFSELYALLAADAHASIELRTEQGAVIAKVRAAGSEGALQLSETRVPPYGLTVRYGRAATAVLSQWEQRSRDRVLSALALVLAALVLAGLLLVHIGRLHRSELSLRASEQHFLTLFEQAPLPLALVRVDDEYMLEMNAAFRRQFGVGERPGGAPALAFWSSAQQHETYRQLLASSRQVAGLDVQLRRHDGCLLECQVSARLLHEDGVAVAIFCAVDLTHQHRIEHEIRELNAALEQRVQQRTLSLEQQHDELRRARDAAELAGRAKARLLAAASHDLRQPLHALSLYSGVLAAAPDAATLAAVGSHIRASVSALGALLNALLDLSKLDAGVYRIERCVLSLSDLLERVCNDYRAQAHDKGLQLRLECPPLLVMSDPVALERIVRNLIDNAVKYSSAGQVVVSAAAIDGRVLATVQDDGPGIAADEQARIFDEFYQIAGAGHEAGLGLGLSIVQRLAGLLDARLSLSSVPGAGAAFSWSMPHFQDVAQVPAAALEADLRGLRVLLVDDDGAILHSMALLLRSWGCSALCAADADAASALMAQHAGAVDVLVLDLRLPDGASGLQLAQQLQQRWGPRPVLLVSGETDGELLRQASASASKVLFKPVTPEVLRAHLGGLT